MAGRSRQPGAELRTERTAVRWTSSEMRRIRDARERMGFGYEADVIRSFTLRQLDEKEMAAFSSEMEAVSEELGGVPPETTVWALARQQIYLRKKLQESGTNLVELCHRLGLDSTEELIWALASRQLDLISSALEKDVAE